MIATHNSTTLLDLAMEELEKSRQSFDAGASVITMSLFWLSIFLFFCVVAISVESERMGTRVGLDLTRHRLPSTKRSNWIGSKVNKEPIYIITELMCNGALLEYLREGDGRHLGLRHLIDIGAQIAHGMSYLEKKSFVHRDLAARNIFVGENNMVKVAGFGLAKLVKDDHYLARKGEKYPVKWTAPESVLYGTFSTKSDVWSFGILLYECVTKGRSPYMGMTNQEVIDLAVHRGYRMPKAMYCPDSLYRMQLKCWNNEAQKRPTFEFLHSFLDDYFVAEEPDYMDPDGV